MTETAKSCGLKSCASHAFKIVIVNAPESLSRRSNLDATLLGRTAPLPIASYFDAAWFERELQHLFVPGPNYAGSEMMVPEVGDYMTLPSTAHGKVLVHGPAGIKSVVQHVPASARAAARRQGQQCRTSFARCTAGRTT